MFIAPEETSGVHFSHWVGAMEKGWLGANCRRGRQGAIRGFGREWEL
jgi:hypothetical protein